VFPQSQRSADSNEEAVMPNKKHVQKALEMVMFCALQKGEPHFVVDDELFNAGRAYGLIKPTKDGDDQFRKMTVYRRSDPRAAKAEAA
jgi:hypothetical protein